MKNILESFAVLLVGILSLLIVFLIVQYNLIEEDTIDDVVPIPIQTKKKEDTTNYLSDMEKYADVDVKVDATKEDKTNSVVVTSELKSNIIDETIDDKSKSAYLQNLEEYKENKIETPIKSESTDAKKAEEEDVEKKIIDGVDDEKQMKAIEEMGNALDSIVDEEEESSSSDPKPMESIDDEIGMAIDAALDDL